MKKLRKNVSFQKLKNIYDASTLSNVNQLKKFTELMFYKQRKNNSLKRKVTYKNMLQVKQRAQHRNVTN